MKKWWYGLFALLIISLFIDGLLVNFFVQNRISFLNEFVIWFTSGFTFLFAMFIFASAFLWNEKKTKWIIPLWLAGGCSYILALLLKLLFVKIRPTVSSLITPETFYSFPSGHAAIVFSALPILDKEFPKLKWFWFVFAILVLLSRLYVGVHYASDLISGCILGFFIGFLVLKLFSKKRKKKRR